MFSHPVPACAILSNKELGFSQFLKRNDLAESELGIKAYQKLFPIPEQQLHINPNLAQNPGY